MSDLIYLPVEDRAPLALASLVETLANQEPTAGNLNAAAQKAAENWAVEGESVEEIAAALTVSFLLAFVTRMAEDD